MKLSSASPLLGAAAALFLGAARAQECLSVALTAIPSCAQSCFLDDAPSIGCDSTDFACQCEKEAALYAAVEGCVSTGCPEASFQAVIDGASSVCNCATGVTVATTTGANGAVATTTSTSLAGGSTVGSYYTSASPNAQAASPSASSSSVSTSISTSLATTAVTAATTAVTSAAKTSAISTAASVVTTAGAPPANRAAVGLVGVLGAVVAGALL